MGMISAILLSAGLFSAALAEPRRTGFEFHFTEGFSGQEVRIVMDGRVIARAELRTRFQIGLAHIEAVGLPGGKEVIVDLGRDGEARLRLDEERPFVTVSLAGGKLTVAASADRPGYL